MRPADPHAAVSDSLQADVMRFMAIIAFCLIAILALVRSVEAPPPEQKAQPLAQPDKGPPEQPAPVEPVPVPRPAVASVRQPRPEIPAPEVPAAEVPAAVPAAEVAGVDVPAAQVPAPEDSPAETETETETDTAAATTPAPPRTQADEPVTPPSPAPAERGLSLRFLSDRDFLRLVSRGEVRVYAYRKGEVLALDEDFRFQPAAAPGAVHELLPRTIPALVVSALGSSQRADGYHWAVTLPAAMTRKIRGFVDAGVAGELVIDRFGEVHHRAGA